MTLSPIVLSSPFVCFSLVEIFWWQCPLIRDQSLSVKVVAFHGSDARHAMLYISPAKNQKSSNFSHVKSLQREIAVDSYWLTSRDLRALRIWHTRFDTHYVHIWTAEMGDRRPAHFYFSVFSGVDFMLDNGAEGCLFFLLILLSSFYHHFELFLSLLFGFICDTSVLFFNQRRTGYYWWLVDIGAIWVIKIVTVWKNHPF